MYTFLSIDPGSNNMGITIQGFENPGDPLTYLHCTSTNLKSLAYALHRDVIVNYSEKQAKLLCVREVVYKFLATWHPCNVVCESPYMSKFPAAYGALMECLGQVRSACLEYNPHMPFSMIDPSTVKKAVGVPGNTGDKNLMRTAVGNLVGDQFNLDFCDEHAVDSVAVGYGWYRQNMIGDL